MFLEKLEQESNWEGDVQLVAISGSPSSDDPSQSATFFRLSISPIVETADTSRGYIFVFSDISEQRRAALELERSRQILFQSQRIAMIGQIANVLAHEINQPLGAISNYSGAMLHGLKNDGVSFDMLIEGLGLIQEQAIRAGEITGQLRTNASPKANSSQVCDVNSLIHESLKLIDPVFRDHRVKLELALGSTPMLVNADRIQLIQVLVNVLKNAAEAIDSAQAENRACYVSTRLLEDEVEVRIQDFGEGLCQQEIESLFVPSVSNKKGGLGLGLCISHSIMKEHRGCILVENGPTGGLVVYLRLPAAAKQLADQQVIR